MSQLDIAIYRLAHEAYPERQRCFIGFYPSTDKTVLLRHHKRALSAASDALIINNLFSTLPLAGWSIELLEVVHTPAEAKRAYDRHVRQYGSVAPAGWNNWPEERAAEVLGHHSMFDADKNLMKRRKMSPFHVGPRKQGHAGKPQSVVEMNSGEKFSSVSQAAARFGIPAPTIWKSMRLSRGVQGNRLRFVYGDSKEGIDENAHASA